MEMHHRRSRLSSDGEQRPRRTSSTSSREKTRCPSCGQRRLTKVSVDGKLTVSICSGCGWGYDVDDSVDAESMTLLLVDEDFACDECRNNDVNRFDLVESPHPDRLCVKCTNCFKVTDIPLKDCGNEGPCNDLGRGTWMAEVMGNRKTMDKDRSGSSRTSGDSGCVVDSKEDLKARGCKEDGVSAQLFNCRCGSNEVGCFRSYLEAASRDLQMVTCRCDHQGVARSFFGVGCCHCGNSTEELFERQVDDYGRITWLRCFVCDKPLHLPGQPRPRKETGPEKLPCPSGPPGHLECQPATDASGVGLGWTKIEDLSHIQRGDHVARHKWYGVRHHAIVVDVPDGARALTVIHYNGGVFKLDGHFASIRLETIDVNPKKEDIYRIDYPTGDASPVDEVVQRACDRLGEAKYNPLSNNCEHFARWCKTGRAECAQVRNFRLACQNAIVGQVLIPVPFIGGFIGCKYKIGNRIGLAAIKR